MLLCDICRSEGKDVEAVPAIALKGPTPEIELDGIGKVPFTINFQLASKGKIHLCPEHYTDACSKLDFRKMIFGAEDAEIKEAKPEDQ